MTIKQVMSLMGRKGGQVKGPSKARDSKTAAAAANVRWAAYRAAKAKAAKAKAK